MKKDIKNKAYVVGIVFLFVFGSFLPVIGAEENPREYTLIAETNNFQDEVSFIEMIGTGYETFIEVSIQPVLESVATVAFNSPLITPLKELFFSQETTDDYNKKDTENDVFVTEKLSPEINVDLKERNPPAPLNPSDPWWNTSWMYRKEITMNHTKVAASLTNFPVLVSFASDADLANNAQDDGDDIVFTTVTGVKLNHEIELFDGSSGKLVAWVNVTSLSSSSNTNIYLYYGNNLCDTQEDGEGVWDSNYRMVHHLNETSGTHYDSTLFGNNGTCSGSMNQDAVGKIDGADEFDGTNDYINVGSGSSIDDISKITISCWIKVDTFTVGRYIFDKGFTSGKSFYLHTLGYLCFIQGFTSYGWWNAPSAPLALGNWYYVTVTYDSSSITNDPKIFVNGNSVTVVEGNTPTGSLLSDSSINGVIGAKLSGTPAYMDGIIDEIQISSKIRNESWINTCYQNQNNPSNFYIIKPAETRPTRPILSDPVPANAAVNIPRGVIKLEISADDLQGDYMTVIFRTNATGSWADIGTNSSVPNGTYRQTATFDEYDTTYWWSVNATDPLGSGVWTNQSYHFTTELPPPAWWDLNWLYRKEITIDHTKIPGDLSNFPVLITVVDSDLITHAQSDGDDIVFTDRDGTQLAHEIESFNSETGSLVAWVNVESLSSSVNTTLLMYYGQPYSASQQNPAAVWDAGFHLVEHLEETSGTHYDSTSFGNNGICVGSLDQNGVGIIDGADDFDGVDDYITYGDPSSLEFTTELTLEAWVNHTSLFTPQNQNIIAKWHDDTGRSFSLTKRIAIDKNISFYISSNHNQWDLVSTISGITANTWHHIVATFNNGQMKIYVDGMLNNQKTSTHTTIYNTGSIDLQVGHAAKWGGYTNTSFNGGIDEVRISNVARSPNWIATCYANQQSPSTFCSFGEEEVSIRLDEPMVYNESPKDSAINVVLNPILSVQVIDWQGDDMNVYFRTNASGSWTTIGSNMSIGNKTVTCQNTNSINTYLTKYWWSINTTDSLGSTKWTNITFTFTTRPVNMPPSLTNPKPNDGASNVYLNPDLSIDVDDFDNNPLNISFKTNASGQWVSIGIYNDVYNGTYTQSTSNMEIFNKKYYWCVNVTDGKTWTNTTYSFITCNSEYYHRQIGRYYCAGLPYFGRLKNIDTFAVIWYAHYHQEPWPPNGKNLLWYTMFNKTNGWAQGDYFNMSWLFDWDYVSPSAGPSHWGYFGDQYHVYWVSGDDLYELTAENWSDYPTKSDETFFADLSGTHPWGSVYAFNNSYAINFISKQYPSPNGNTIVYWIWNNTSGWSDIVPLWSTSTGGTDWFTHDVAGATLLPINRTTWYLYYKGGGTGAGNLKVIKTFDAGKTWDTPQLVMNLNWRTHRPSFIRYGENYYMIVNKDGNDISMYSSTDGLTWGNRQTVSSHNTYSPNGIMLDQSRVLWAVSTLPHYPDTNMVGDVYAGVYEIPEMISYPKKPTNPYPTNGTSFAEGTTSTTLEVTVSGTQTYDVAFYWANHTYIGEDKLLTAGDIARVQVTNLQNGVAYQWYAIARGTTYGYWGDEPRSTSDENRSDLWEFTITTQYPIIADIYPENNSQDIPLDTSQLQFTIHDFQGDLMNYTIITSPNIGIGSGAQVTNGTYNLVVDGLASSTKYTWSISCNDGVHWNNKSYCFTTEKITIADPFSQGWQYRRKITLNHSFVTTDLLNFPALIHLTDSTLLYKTQADGDDIIFMDGADASNQLYHEIEKFDSITGELIVWVNIPSLSSSYDTEIWMYYGNPNYQLIYEGYNVWDLNFDSIWHFNETDGVVCRDSTSNNVHGAINGAVTLQQEGIVGYCYDFNANADGTIKGDVTSLQNLPNGIHTSWTVEGWINLDSMPVSYGNLIATDSVGSGTEKFPGQLKKSGNLALYGADSLGLYSTNLLPIGKTCWVYVAVTSDGVHTRLYWNGSEHISMNSARTLGGEWRLGNKLSGAQNEQTDACFDEIRVSKTSRSAGWIETTYNTIRYPQLFVSFDAEECNEWPDEPVLYNPIPRQGSIGIKLNPVLSIFIADGQADQMDIFFRTNASGSWSTIGSHLNVGNGTYTCSNTNDMNHYKTRYWWSVNATDYGSGNWTNQTFSFTTIQGAPIADNEYPADLATYIPLNPVLSISIQDYQSDSMDLYFRTNASGLWQTIGSNLSVFNGTYYCSNTIHMDDYNDTYWWSINITDANEWTNETYSFKTVPNEGVFIQNIDYTFEGASLKSLTQLGHNSIGFEINDSQDPSYTCWFFFNITHGALGQTVEFTTQNGNTGLYHKCVYSYDGITWNYFAASQPKWSHTFTQDSVLIAWTYPYQYSFLEEYLDGADLLDLPFYNRTIVGQSVEGRNIELITITNFSIPLCEKKTIWVITGQHPNEKNSQFQTWFMLNFLLNETNPLAEMYRDKYMFKIFPMMNPDGVFHGYNRYNKNLQDLNREWDDGEGNYEPEIDAMFGYLKNWLNNGNDVDIFIDQHDLGGYSIWTIPSAYTNSRVYTNVHDFANFMTEYTLYPYWGDNWYYGRSTDVLPAYFNITGLTPENRPQSSTVTLEDLRQNALNELLAFDDYLCDSLNVKSELPINGSFISTATVLFEYNVSSTLHGLVNASLYIDDVYIMQNTTPVVLNQTNNFSAELPSGGHTWFIRCIDRIGNIDESCHRTITRIGNAPFISNEIPKNGASNIPLAPVLSAHVIDIRGYNLDIYFRSNVSGSWTTIGSFIEVGNDTYTCSNTGNMNKYETKYWWSVNATDDGSGNWTNQTYSFTTIRGAPMITSVYPVNNATYIPLDPVISVHIEDYQADSMNLYFRTNVTGPWVTIGSNLSISNGTYSCSDTLDFDQYGTWYWWSVNVSDTGGLWTNETYLFKTELEPGVWWDDSWLYRKEIILNHTRVAGNLSNFSVMISIVDEDLSDNAQSDADDLVFTDYYGVRLAHEIEFYDQTTGSLIVWVNVPYLSTTADIALYMYYGNSVCDSQQNSPAVWDAGYRMVQHLDETSGLHYDSTVYGNNGTCNGGVNQNAVGMIDGTDDFDGSDDYVNCGNDGSLDITEKITIEAWIRPDTIFTDWRRILIHGTSTSAGYQFNTHGNELTFSRCTSTDWLQSTQRETTSVSLTVGTWYHVAAVYDAGTFTIYVNGQSRSLAAGAQQGYGSGSDVLIGRRSDGYAFDGKIDEVRISASVRNTSWISTCYQNQNNPSGFYTVGSQESRSNGPVLSNPVPADYENNVVVGLRLLEITAHDFEGDLMTLTFRTNVSGSWVVIGTNTSVPNGTYRQAATFDEYDTNYWWSVNATDSLESGEWTNHTYTFTTILGTPIITDEYPANEAMSIPFHPILSVHVEDPQSNDMNLYFRSNATGPWVTIGLNMSVPNGTYSCSDTLDFDEYDTWYWWSVNVSDADGLWSNETYLFRTELEPGVWWDTTWLYRKEIILNHTRVAGNLSNFPVLISIIDNDLGDYAQSDADDLVFTDYYGVRLAHEIEYFDEMTGNLIVWVKVPYLSMTVDSILYMYYGNPVCDSQQNSHAVWDAGYRMVQHLDETSGLHYDSTVYGNNGTCNGGVNQDAVGMIDGADSFDGTDDYIDCKNRASVNLTGPITVEAWVKLNAKTADSRIIHKYDGSHGWILWYDVDDDYWVFLGRDGAAMAYAKYTQSHPSVDVWYHVVGIYDGAKVSVVVNGVTGAGQESLTSMSVSPNNLFIGKDFVQGYCNGFIDEVRVSTVVRNQSWLSTSFVNQNDPASFFSIGEQQTRLTPLVSNPVPADGLTNVLVTLTQLSFTIADPQGNSMSYIVGTTPAIGSDTQTGKINGTYYASISGLIYDTTYTWFVNCSNGVYWTNKTFSFSTESLTIIVNNPFTQGWQYRKPIIINHTQVAGNLQGFPVLINIIDSDLAGKAQLDGDDILFMNDTGEATQLPHEIEYYDSGTGKLVVWVNVTSLSSTVDTVIYMYYGNSICDSMENVTRVWDTNYRMVQHLDETSGLHYDSTLYGNNGTCSGGVNQNVVGMIDGADDFDGNDDYVNCGNDGSLDITEKITVEAWIRPDTIFTDWRRILIHGTSTAAGYQLCTHGNELVFSRCSSTDYLLSTQRQTSGAGLASSTWYYVTAVYDAGTFTIYINGVSKTLAAGDRLGYGAGSDLLIGRRPDGYGFDGIIDEARVSSVARNQSWIHTTYLNQVNPVAFLYLGDEQTAEMPEVSNPVPADGAVNVPVTLTQLSFSITDLQGDSMSYSVGTTPPVGSDSQSGKTNGTYTVSISGLLYSTVYSWYVNCSDGTSWTNMTFSFSTESLASVTNPFAQGWQYRKQIIINHTQVSGNLQGFPVLIKITDIDLSEKAQIDGDDLVFMNDTGEAIQLPHQIEYYNSTTGELVVWVNVTSLSSTVDTIIYMYYGNSICDSMENVTRVWDTNYRMVHHLDETSGTHYDSTKYGNNGTCYQGVNQNVVGMIDGADGFDGVNDYINCSTKSSLQFGTTTDFTMEAWVKEIEPPIGSEYHRIINIAKGSGNWVSLYTNSDGRLRFLFGGSSAGSPTGGTIVRDGAWHYVVAVFDRDFGAVQSWVDAVKQNNVPLTLSGVSGNGAVCIGKDPNYNLYPDCWNGSIDEVRISAGIRNTSWITTCYHNQGNPTMFYSVGLEEQNDTIPPEITNVTATPESQVVGNYVNITCDISDNVGVNEVRVVISYPDSSSENLTMDVGSYYKNQTYIQVGTHSYHIWVNDTSNNSNRSGVYSFYIYDSSLVYVDDDYTSVTPGWGYDHFDVIQDAVDAVDAGGSVVVYAGTYYEDQIIINKAVTVQGDAGWASTIIDGGSSTLTSAGLVRIIASGDVTFSGFTVRNAGGPPNGGDYNDDLTNVGIYAQSGSSSATYRISGNKILGTNVPDDWEDYGFYTHGGLEHLIFTNNIVTEQAGNAVLVERHVGVTDITYNTLDAGCWGIDPVYFMTYSGLDITSLQNVSNNTIDVGTGVNPHGVGDNKITAIGFSSAYLGCTGVDDSGKYTNIWICDNIINNLAAYERGIALDNFAWGDGAGGEISGAVIRGNVITGVSSAAPSFGVRLSGLVSNAVVEENVISGCDMSVLGTCGFYGGSTAYPVGTLVSYNNFVGNGGGLVWDGLTVFDARFNWWGDASGPYHAVLNPGGLGDSVSDGVLFAPWYDDAYPDGSLTSAPPEISNMVLTNSNPKDTNPVFGWENITAIVTDDVAISQVRLNITYPDMHTENISILSAGGGMYYYNTTVTSVGSYSYFIWVIDTTSVSKKSGINSYTKPPNWDINMDGICNVLDVSQISSKWMQTGVPGWIREDINNDGTVNIIDVSTISAYWMQTWS